MKPCPFCGGDDLTLGHFGHSMRVVCIDCHACGAIGGPGDDREADAIRAWNERARTHMVASTALLDMLDHHGRNGGAA